MAPPNFKAFCNAPKLGRPDSSSAQISVSSRAVSQGSAAAAVTTWVKRSVQSRPVRV